MERDHRGDPEIDGTILLRWIFKKWKGVETGWSWLRIETDGGTCEYGDELPGSIKGREFLD